MVNFLFYHGKMEYIFTSDWNGKKQNGKIKGQDSLAITQFASFLH
jgi:hypothetical protein